MATYARTVGQGLPRQPSGEPWPPVDAPVPHVDAVPPSDAPVPQSVSAGVSGVDASNVTAERGVGVHGSVPQSVYRVDGIDDSPLPF